jgi:hypothetical protein
MKCIGEMHPGQRFIPVRSRESGMGDGSNLTVANNRGRSPRGRRWSLMGGRHPHRRLTTPCFPFRVFLHVEVFSSNQSTSHLDAFAPSPTKPRRRRPLICSLHALRKTSRQSVQPHAAIFSSPLSPMQKSIAHLSHLFESFFMHSDP